MNKVLISKVGCETALGSGPEKLWLELLAGRSGIKPLTRFNCENYVSNLAAGIDDLAIPAGSSRHDDLLDRVADQVGPIPADSRLLVASTKGEIDRLQTACRHDEPVPASALFEPLLAKISRRFDLIDHGTNINAACASSTIAIARGAAMIAHGQAESVLVYAADLLSEFVFSGFSALQALSPTPARPFDAQRQGLNLGEAGAALLLTNEKRAGDSPLAQVAGWGAANDAHHVTAPARDGSGLILACREAMQRAGIDPDQVAAINAHGTGTPYNDAMELTAFDSLFGKKMPPLHGVKGSLGHTLGAAAALETIVGGFALTAKKIPGTVGCTDPEEVGMGRIGTATQSIDGDYLLTTNSGFGGINGALVLQGAAS